MCPSRPKLLKIAEVCEWVCVSKSTIYKWVQEGSFPKPLIYRHILQETLAQILSSVAVPFVYA